MEKQNYRITLEQVRELFPGRLTLSPEEVAKILGCDRKTVYSAINRRKNPLPSTRLSTKRILVPIASFASWLSA